MTHAEKATTNAAQEAAKNADASAARAAQACNAAREGATYNPLAEVTRVQTWAKMATEHAADANWHALEANDKRNSKAQRNRHSEAAQRAARLADEAANWAELHSIEAQKVGADETDNDRYRTKEEDENEKAGAQAPADNDENEDWKEAQREADNAKRERRDREARQNAAQTAAERAERDAERAEETEGDEGANAEKAREAATKARQHENAAHRLREQGAKQPPAQRQRYETAARKEEKKAENEAENAAQALANALEIADALD